MHKSDYISCFFSCCQPSFRDELLSRLETDELRTDYVQLQRFIVDAVHRIVIKITKKCGKCYRTGGTCIEYESIEYERAWEECKPTQRYKPPPTLNKDTFLYVDKIFDTVCA